MSRERRGGLAGGAYGLRGSCFGPGTQPPDQSATEYQADRDQLGSAHRSAEDGAAAGIVAEIFEEESSDAVDEQEGAKDLAVEFPAFQQPHEEEEVCELDGELKELRGFERNAERRSGD